MQVNLPNHRGRYRCTLTVLLEVDLQSWWRMLLRRWSRVLYLCCSAWCNSPGLSPPSAQTEGGSGRRPPARPPHPATRKSDRSWCSRLQEHRGRGGRWLYIFQTSIPWLGMLWGFTLLCHMLWIFVHNYFSETINHSLMMYLKWHLSLLSVYNIPGNYELVGRKIKKYSVLYFVFNHLFTVYLASMFHTII